MSSLSFYLPLVTKTVPTRRRCRVIAAAAAGAAILPLSVPLGARASPGGRETGTLLILSSKPFAHRRRRSLTAAAAETSSRQRHHDNAGK